jgi:hypothetical protein
VLYCSYLDRLLQRGGAKCLSLLGGGGIYVRKVKSRGSGPYFQLVRAFRNEEGQPRQEVLVHLGVHETPEAAMASWPDEVAHLRRIGRERQADRLEANLKKLRALTEAEKREE